MVKDRKRIRRKLLTAPITVEQIVAWANEYYQRHGRWPGTSPSRNLPSASMEQILAWAEEWHEEHGRWPGEDDGEKNADAEPE